MDQTAIEKPRVRVPAGSRPSMSYFHNEQNPFMVSWLPQLREQSQDVQQAWTKSASRAIDAIHNSGFITKVVEVTSSATVGSGLRLSSRPDADALGWSEDEANKWAAKVESEFKAWAENPVECDAAGKSTFDQLQQAAFACWLAYGENLALTPMLKRRGAIYNSKISLLPPSRLSNKTEKHNKIVQGVKTDGWGYPQSYFIKDEMAVFTGQEREIKARDSDGRPNVLHFMEPGVAVNRGISVFAPVLKVYRQVQQYADATLTTKLIQTIFAATIKSNISGLAAFDGLMTNGDTGALDAEKFATAKGEWYDGAKIDLTQHGRIAQLFPNDELTFTEASKTANDYDAFMGWLMREIAAGAGVTYENATGDYRGATYSSIRMGGAQEWLTVLRRRKNICAPFAQAGFEIFLEEAIGTGRIPFKGGLPAYLRAKQYAAKASWAGPARPQADDFKTARAYEVRKDIGATTLAEISEEYGGDWDDDMRQRSRENALALELGLPKPWSAKDPLELEGGEELALNDPGTPDPADKKRKKRKKTTRDGIRNPGEDDPEKAMLEEIDPDVALEKELEDDLSGVSNHGD